MCMITPKTLCGCHAEYRHLGWCQKNCTRAGENSGGWRAADRAKKELMRAIPEKDGSITLERAQEILRLNAMRSPEDQKRNPRPVRIITTGRIYPSVAQAARVASDLTTRHIKDYEVVNVCMGRHKTLYGLKLEYVRLEVAK